MADKIVIGEVDLNIDKAVQDAQSLKQTINILKEEMAKAKDVSGETSKQYIELSAGLKQAQKEYNTQINLIGKSVEADTAKTGSMQQLRAQLSVVSAQWAALSEDERKNTDLGKQLTKQKKDLTEQLLKEEKATGDARRQVGFYERGMQDANSAIATFIPGAQGATGAAKALGVAFKVMLGPVGLVIAAVAAVVGALKSFFTSSEEGQNVLKKFQAVFGVVFNNLNDVLSKFGEAIVFAFTKPKEAIEALKQRLNAIKEFFVNTFGNIIGGEIQKFVANFVLGFDKLGLAWQKLKGLFVDNAEGINKAQESIQAQQDKIKDANDRIKLGTENLKNSAVRAWNNIKQSVTDYIDEQKREIDIAKQLADQQANLDKLIRQNIVLESKDRLALSELKNKINDKENTSAEERIKLIDEENAILDKIVQRNLEIAQQKYEIKKAQNELSNSTKEDLDEEARLLADIYKAEEQVNNQRNEAITQRIEAERQLIAEKQAAADEAIRILEEQIERQKEIEEEERQRKLEQIQLDFENDLAISEGNMFAELEVNRRKLEFERQQEVENAKKIGADVNKVNLKYQKANLALDRAEFNAKLSLAQGFAGNLATIFGEQTALGKAAAIAQTTIATIQSGVNSYNSLSTIPVVGPVLGAAAAAAALISGYAQVKEILKVKSGLPGDSVSASAPSGNTSAFSSAAISVPRETSSASVGQGIVARDVDTQTQTSIANGVSQALSETPIQPTLVTDDVTLNQSSNLNKNRTSTL